MKNGLVVKLIGGLYTVLDKESDELVQCKGRGILRHKDTSPKVGDRVYYDVDKSGSGYIAEVLERDNELLRPPVANIDQVLIVTSATNPDFSSNLLDRMITLVEHNHIDIVIVITKVDLLTEAMQAEIDEICKYYSQFYTVIQTSTKKLINMDQIKEVISNKISVLAGQTGAGKSSLLNSIEPSFELKTQEISKALGRGKHTTRHSELHRVGDGHVADTPGFSSLEFGQMDLDELSHCFVDMFALSDGCKFRGCKHINEPKCAVKDAVEANTLLQSRYDNYKLFVEEIKNTKIKY